MYFLMHPISIPAWYANSTEKLWGSRISVSQLLTAEPFSCLWLVSLCSHGKHISLHGCWFYHRGASPKLSTTHHHVKRRGRMERKSEPSTSNTLQLKPQPLAPSHWLGVNVTHFTWQFGEREGRKGEERRGEETKVNDLSWGVPPEYLSSP